MLRDLIAADTDARDGALRLQDFFGKRELFLDMRPWRATIIQEWNMCRADIAPARAFVVVPSLEGWQPSEARGRSASKTGGTLGCGAIWKKGFR